MSFNFNSRNPPLCENPKCKGRAVLMVGTQFFCGDCAQRVMKIKNDKEKAYIMEKLKDAT